MSHVFSMVAGVGVAMALVAEPGWIVLAVISAIAATVVKVVFENE